MGSTPTSKETEQSRTFLYHLKIRTQQSTKLASSIGTNVRGWTAMRSK